MTRVVLDTNILVSSLFSSRGNEARVLDLLHSGKILAFITPAILAEYETVLRRPKFAFASPESLRLLHIFQVRALRVDPAVRLRISPDDADNRFLECAEAASADFLITGNRRHFPASHGVTRIDNAVTFLEWFMLQQR